MTPVELYEELEELRQDPEAFQYRAKAILEEYFASLPEDQAQRARQFQWRLDNELRHYVDPVARMNKMVELFWAGVKDFQKVLNDPQSFQVKSQDGAKVIPFKR